MPVLLAPFLAQLLTLGVSDRSEARYLQQDRGIGEASSTATVQLTLRTRRSDLVLAYVPTFLLTPLERSPRERLLFHNFRLLDTYRLKRTTFTFSSGLGFGEVNLRTAALQGLGTPPAGQQPVGAGMPPGPTDSNKPATPTTPSDQPPTQPTGQPLPGQTAVPGQTVISDRVVHNLLWNSTLTLSQQLKRDLTVSAYVGYSASGGLDEEARKAYPFTRGVSVGGSGSYTRRLPGRNLFVSAGSAQQIWSSSDNNVTVLQLNETWTHLVTARTRYGAGGGLSASRFSLKDGTVGISIFPNFAATVAQEVPMGRVSWDFGASAYSAPALDPIRATVDPRVGVAGVIRLSGQRFSLVASGGAARSLAPAGSNVAAINSYTAGFLATKTIATWLSVDAGVRSAFESYRGKTTVPPSWAAFAGVTLNYELLVTGRHR